MKRRNFMKLCGAALVTPALLTLKKKRTIRHEGGMVSPDNCSCNLSFEPPLKNSDDYLPLDNTTDTIDINDGQWHCIAINYNNESRVIIGEHKTWYINCNIFIDKKPYTDEMFECCNFYNVIIKDFCVLSKSIGLTECFTYKYIGEGKNDMPMVWKRI